jgi:hypothetical protein
MTSGATVLVVNAVVLTLVWGTLVAACVLAWWKGRIAERVGATLYFVSALIHVGLYYATGQSVPPIPELFGDAVVAFGFLVLAIRYNSLWLGVAMLAKGLQLSLHATHLTDHVDPVIGHLNLYLASLDAVSVAISGSILAGTVSAMRGREGPKRHGAGLRSNPVPHSA